MSPLTLKEYNDFMELAFRLAATNGNREEVEMNLAIEGKFDILELLKNLNENTEYITDKYDENEKETEY